MSKDIDTNKVADFQEAYARRGAEEISADIANKEVRALMDLQHRSKLKGRAGKVPPAQRAQWAKNVRNLINEVRESGFGVRDLYNASTEDLFRETYEDSQAYSKNLTALQKLNSPKQVVGYDKYLEFIKLVSRVTGQSLQYLAGRITEGVALVGNLAAIPDGCFELAKELELIANRVARQEGLVQKFQKLAQIREQHLCTGGSCVWPDADFYFEENAYTPLPGKKICDIGVWIGDQNALRDSKYHDCTIGSLREEEGDDELVAEGKRSFRTTYIEFPALRRMAKNAYYFEREIAHYDQRSSECQSGKLMTVSPYGESLFFLPLHYAGELLEPQLLSNIRGDYLIRQKEELDGCLEWCFNRELPIDYFGPKSDLCNQFQEGEHFAIFLYPNEDCTGLRPIIKLGSEEGCYVVPLDAGSISELAESVVLPRNKEREFPYQTESLLTYLRRIIDTGELERDWRNSSYLVNECPLWCMK